jgi:hypothetical protein
MYQMTILKILLSAHVSVHHLFSTQKCTRSLVNHTSNHHDVFLASGANTHASSPDPTPKAPSFTSAGGDLNATDATEMVPLPSEGDMPDAQSTNQHLSSKKQASQIPETPTNSENLSPGENMEMDANSGDALAA